MKVVYYNVRDPEAEIQVCNIIGTPCDNPLGCLACFHQEVEDYRAFYMGEGPVPFTAVKLREEKYADR